MRQILSGVFANRSFAFDQERKQFGELFLFPRPVALAEKRFQYRCSARVFFLGMFDPDKSVVLTNPACSGCFLSPCKIIWRKTLHAIWRSPGARQPLLRKLEERLLRFFAQ